jgi:cytochrome P450
VENPYKEPRRKRPEAYIAVPKKITKKIAERENLQLPKGPRKLTTINFMKNTADFLEKTRKKYGNTSSFFLYGKLFYLLVEPEDVQAVLTAPKNTMLKGHGFKILRLGLGEGLLTSEEPIHLQHKRIIAPLFNKDNLENYIERISKIVDEKLEELKETENWVEFDPLNFSTDISLKVITDLVFGEGETEQVGKITAATMECMKQIASPIPNWRKYRKAIKQLTYYTNKLLDEGKWREGKPNILLEMVTREGGGGEKLSRQDLNDELQTLIVTGYETQSAVLVVSLLKLAEDHGRYHKLKKEGEQAAWVKENRAPKVNEILEETYCNYVLNETMRIEPPGWFIPRLCAIKYTTPNITIQKGAQVFVSPYVSHRNPEYFKNPEKWDPERWENDFKQSLPKGVYYPFGGGSRMCIGEHLSTLTLKITLLKIAAKYDIKTINGKANIKMKKTATNHPIKTNKILIKKTVSK